ncbi:hypothetical protein N0V84_009307 [Fusarium piperis]|uniref:DUF7371 domain-containing protein n=1 Tax=Fusarium piperis TaxID=1435070 RepID=A0A9W9BIW8_9HYPO|nr:hypothetical protein N0V84_009307 [Fusarium piperis]
MRISASLGFILASGLLGHSGAQTVDYATASNGNPGGNPGDGSGSIPPGNPNGAPGSAPFPGNVPGSPGSFPGGGDPTFPDTAPGGLPPNIPGGAPGTFPGSGPANAPGSPHGGSSANVPGDIPGGVPGGVPGSVPGASSVAFPPGSPNDIPHFPQNAPNAPGSPVIGASSIPTCPLTTKTVVVTVLPTGPHGGSGFPAPGRSGPQQTAVPAPFPTKPPQFSAPGASPVVSPFTTLTVDLWGPGSGPGAATGPGSGNDDAPGSGDSNAPGSGDSNAPGSGDSNAPGSGDRNAPGSNSGNINPNTGAGSGDNIGSDHGSGSGLGGSNDGADSSGLGNSSDDGTDSGMGNSANDGVDSGVSSNSNDGTHSPFSSSFPGPNPAPKYSEPAPGDSSGNFPSGPGSNTLGPVPSPFQIPSPSGPGGFPGSQPQNPSQGPVQEASDSLPVTTQAGPQVPGGNSPWFTTVGGGDNAGQPRSPWITVTGQDGRPTVINAPGSPQPSTPWLTITGQDGLPTVITGGDDTVPGQNEPHAPWLTITGQDGLPTVIGGGHGAPTDQPRPSTPWVTITGQDGLPTVVSSGDEVIPGQAEPHTPWLTITGQDGLPTVINSPGPNQPSTPWLTITGQNGLPTVISGGQATAPGQPQPSTPWLTVTGQDGRPTVINAPGSQLSTPWLTITGQDGLPTVISGGDSTAPGQAQPPSFTGFPQGQGLPSGISAVPLPLPSAPGIPGDSGSQSSDQVLPSGIPFPIPSGPGAPLPGDGSGLGITTCTSFTTTGADGLPTVVDSTWVIPFTGPVAEASSQLPAPGFPQGSLSGIPFDVGSIPTGSFPAPGSPQDDSGSLVATTCTSFTLIGTDGLPTVVHSTWTVPAGTPGSGDSAGIPGPISTGASLPSFPTAGPAGIPTGFPAVSDLNGATPITTHTSYTIIGSDGLPTVVDSTLVIPGPLITGSAIIGNPEGPSEASDALPNGITSAANDQASGLPGASSSGSAGSGVVTGGGITTCTSFTMIGPDGLPTVVDSTWVIPGTIDTQPGNPALTSDAFSSGLPSGVPGNPSFVSDAFPSGLPTGAPGQVTAAPGLPSGSNPGDQAGITTCITYTVLGTDGLPTIIDSTLVIPTGTEPTGTSLGLPSVTGAPQPDSSDDSAGTFATLTTAIVIGPDGKPTLTVQTVIFGDSSALGVSTSAPQGTISGIPSLPPFGPIITSVDMGPLVTGSPSIDSYGAIISDQSMSGLVADSSADAQDDSVTGTVTGTLTWTVTSVVDSTGGPVFSSGGADPLAPYNTLGNSVPGQVPDGPTPSELTLWPLSSLPVTLQTSTWTNVVVEETTSYTLNFPLTTLATITVGKRHIRRQEASVWSNSSTSEASSASTSTTSSDASSTSICATGLSIGNTTIDFDNSKAGPLFNPQENIWFSSGFLIAPPTSEQPQPYIPSSGGQLVEFVPPALSNTTTTGSGDVAQIGMGPHAPSPCFRFDFFGASLGCDAQGNEKWCEFEISAYRWNDTSSSEESIAWSEIKQVPACPTFSEGGYELTRIDLDGYTDLSSVLITLRVSQELRVWWGDDFRVGWADNTCDAAACRTHAPTYLMKEEAVADAVRQGVFQWSRINKFDRIDDAVV